MTAHSASRTLFFFEKPSAMRQLQRFFKSPSTICVSAEGHLLAAEEPGTVRDEWKSWRFDTLPIVLERIPVTYGTSRSGQSHKPKVEAIKQALQGVERVIIATDPGREGSMIAWEVLEHLGYRGRVDRLKLGALDEISIRRAFAAMAKEPDSGERDYAAYLEALCRQYEDYHLGLNGTRAISLRLRPPAFREPWRFGGVQTPTLAILADLEKRIRDFVPQDYFKIALTVATDSGAEITLWHAPKDKILEKQFAEIIQQAAVSWSGPLGVEQKDVRRSPPRLFSKDTLARRCAKRFGWDPQHTAKLAQDLYDQGYLTYPRTESEHLPESQTGDASAVIEQRHQGSDRSCAPRPSRRRSCLPQGQQGPLRQGSRRAPRHRATAQGASAGERQRRSSPSLGVGGQELPGGPPARRHRCSHHRRRAGSDAARPEAVFGQRQRDQVARLARRLWRRGRRGERGCSGQNQAGRRAHRRTPATDSRQRAWESNRCPDRDSQTEPPRRITRGELPVVMGRLIDQVEDPALKAALENPANPNEPKGLGTAATRDTILPKLQKSQYVDLLQGKDPPIQVTEVGLAFIAAVRRVFPSYGDPVGRAMFEADLAEIGRAVTRNEAVRRAASYQERTRARVQELIGAIAQSQTVAVDPTTVPVSFAPAGKPPTKAMITFAASLAARKGLKLPRGLKSNAAICRAFLDQHAPARSSEAGEHRPQNGPRPPSEAMVRYARALAEEHGVECPPEIATDFAACRAFLDEHASRQATTAEDGSKTTTPQEPFTGSRQGSS